MGWISGRNDAADSTFERNKCKKTMEFYQKDNDKILKYNDPLIQRVYDDLLLEKQDATQIYRRGINNTKLMCGESDDNTMIVDSEFMPNNVLGLRAMDKSTRDILEARYKKLKGARG